MALAPFLNWQRVKCEELEEASLEAAQESPSCRRGSQGTAQRAIAGQQMLQLFVEATEQVQSTKQESRNEQKKKGNKLKHERK